VSLLGLSAAPEVPLWVGPAPGSESWDFEEQVSWMQDPPPRRCTDAKELPVDRWPELFLAWLAQPSRFGS
jgi:hypothetical protein